MDILLLFVSTLFTFLFFVRLCLRDGSVALIRPDFLLVFGLFIFYLLEPLLIALNCIDLNVRRAYTPFFEDLFFGTLVASINIILVILGSVLANSFFSDLLLSLRIKRNLHFFIFATFFITLALSVFFYLPSKFDFYDGRGSGIGLIDFSYNLMPIAGFIISSYYLSSLFFSPFSRVFHFFILCSASLLFTSGDRNQGLLLFFPYICFLFKRYKRFSYFFLFIFVPVFLFLYFFIEFLRQQSQIDFSTFFLVEIEQNLNLSFFITTASFRSLFSNGLSYSPVLELSNLLSEVASFVPFLSGFLMDFFAISPVKDYIGSSVLIRHETWSVGSGFFHETYLTLGLLGMLPASFFLGYLIGFFSRGTKNDFGTVGLFCSFTIAGVSLELARYGIGFVMRFLFWPLFYILGFFS